jgi:hypothetical protein
MKNISCFFVVIFVLSTDFGFAQGEGGRGWMVIPAFVNASGPDWHNKGLGSGVNFSFMGYGENLAYDITAQIEGGKHYKEVEGGHFKFMPGFGLGYTDESSGVGIFLGLSGGLYDANNGGIDSTYSSTTGTPGKDFKDMPLGWSVWAHFVVTGGADMDVFGIKAAYSKGRYDFSDIGISLEVYWFSINMGYSKGAGLKGFFLYPGISIRIR